MTRKTIFPMRRRGMTGVLTAAERQAIADDVSMSALGLHNPYAGKTFQFGAHPNTQNGIWFEVCRWQTTGTFIHTSAIFDVTHRGALSHQELQVQFESDASSSTGFRGAFQLRAKGDAFRDGEEYTLIGSTGQLVRLFHKRATGHVATRGLSVRHMDRHLGATQFSIGSVTGTAAQPGGLVASHITAVS